MHLDHFLCMFLHLYEKVLHRSNDSILSVFQFKPNYYLYFSWIFVTSLTKKEKPKFSLSAFSVSIGKTLT